jgi:ubiquinone/menaquinone biosynthesis C-methylase UbiE
MILHRRRRAVKLLGLQPNSEVLEIGCGTGLNFGYVLDELEAGAGRLTGLDFSGDMLRRAERRTAARGWHNVELLQADATQLALGRQFDAILFAYSLTMIPDWEGALDRAVAHLRVGGRLVVLDFGQFERWWLLGPLMRAWLRVNHVETVRPYTGRLRELVAGFELETWLGGYCFIASGQRRA